MKKIVLLLTSLMLVLTGCGKNVETDPNKPLAGTTIYVYNWGDYIAEDTIERFTKETGIKVIYDTFESNEAMYAKYKSGAINYDVLIPSDYMIQKLISENELLPLNFDNIPNAKYIDSSFKNLTYDPQNIYSVPYMWGTLGIIYNKEMVDEEVDSWDILWDNKYKGKIIMMESVRDSFAVALKRLGYSLNSTNKTEVDEAFATLVEQGPLVQAYVMDQVKDKMIGEEAALAVIYAGDAVYCMDQNENLGYVVPKEGTNFFVDAMVIPKTSKNKEGAEAFINFMNDPEIALNNTEYIGYSTPHTEAKAMLDEEVRNNPDAYPPKELIEKCEVFVDLGPEMTAYYNDKWNELKASLR
ncbi:ABC transporter substrate-binding protein [Acetivibrio clariflavus]|uniref:Spermidine/putrescine-binding periplasmic protein n=1 Tax=Acetivibrio clariflavus (strain DSM 19732 / NBRC 101661 / EBR45) TaxID=720554 RepID=G8LUX3_ACECE|nr:ABC transporter substrate-binding protein [Acetivibrio clariflavus]AEV68503.1 spermidine/putrescine-binding periplasmic protein [Acetivibrio clariflavus DSM 19732]